MFLIKQVSSDLGITPQAIYKQKEELQNKGYMIKNSSNDWEITSDGYNYLKEKQINRFKRNNISLKENDIKSTNLQGKEENNSLNETLINFYETRLEEIKQSYENQLNEQKKQVEYFKNLYEEEKSERIRANAQYQTYLLGTAEDNKRHWWQFWNKTNKERVINVVYNEISITDAEKIIDLKHCLEDKDYEVVLDYDEIGFVYQIRIEDI